jgi:hypothetical protein
LNGRGGDSRIDPGAFGKRLKLLGFVTEPRDAKGKKLRLTDAVHSRALRLARDLASLSPRNSATLKSVVQGRRRRSALKLRGVGCVRCVG